MVIYVIMIDKIGSVKMEKEIKDKKKGSGFLIGLLIVVVVSLAVFIVYDKVLKNVLEYILVEKLEEYGLYKEWILEYEKHLEKIDYRNELKEKYKEYKKRQ